jgi:hypothetical protein
MPRIATLHLHMVNYKLCHFWVRKKEGDRTVYYRRGLFKDLSDDECMGVMLRKLEKEFGPQLSVARFEFEDMIIDYEK